MCSCVCWPCDTKRTKSSDLRRRRRRRKWKKSILWVGDVRMRARRPPNKKKRPFYESATCAHAHDGRLIKSTLIMRIAYTGELEFRTRLPEVWRNQRAKLRTTFLRRGWLSKHQNIFRNLQKRKHLEKRTEENWEWIYEIIAGLHVTS